MSEAQTQRNFEKACQKLASHIVPKKEIQALKVNSELKHLTSRFSTFHIMLHEAIEDFETRPSPSRAVAIILAVDLVWQVMRALGGRQGRDTNWLVERFPDDYESVDADIRDNYFGLQKQIVDDLTWVYDLHTALRHPRKKHDDLLKCLRQPIFAEVFQRLLHTAASLRQVLVCVQVNLDPTVTF
ncbi:MAG: hypothetical protein U5S82_02805 [Gammaproteobacteria bacterium]|nr:hypothetical protein [Gammaproteobacteria bacterium]